MKKEELLSQAANVTVVNDGQVQYPVLTESMNDWVSRNGKITAANYEKFCDEVENLGEPTSLTGSAEMIALCDALVEAGSDTERL
jgi:hypothetical protein